MSEATLEFEYDEQMIVEFLEESLTELQELENYLLEFEQNPQKRELIDHIFRLIHSIKGSAGFFKLGHMQKLAHALENNLDLLRKNELQLSSNIASVLLAGFEELQAICMRFKSKKQEVANEATFEQMIQSLEMLTQQKRELREEVILFIGSLQAFLDQHEAQVVETPSLSLLKESLHGLELLTRDLKKETLQFLAIFKNFVHESQAFAPLKESLMALKGAASRLEASIDTTQKTRHFRKTADYFYGETDVSGEISTIHEILGLSFENALPTNTAQRLKEAISSLGEKIEGNALEIVKAMQFPLEMVLANMMAFDQELQNRLQTQSQQLMNFIEQSGPTPETELIKVEKPEEPKAEKSAERHEVKTMRISEEEIDGFMHFVGELVVVSDMFNYVANEISKSEVDQNLQMRFRQANQNFNVLSQNLRTSLLKIRLLPLEGLLKKIPGLARSVADKLGKQVRVELLGGETKIDKSLYELMDHPLTHLIRNSVDHGLEMPEKRVMAGKNPMGLIRVEARQDEDWVMLTIEDDGGGIPVEKIRQKALEKQLISSEEADRMSEQEVYHLIFLPGFSTAETISDISGRGVGLDVVRQNIESVNGQIWVESTLGKGSVFHIRLPNSTSFVVIDGINARVGRHEYIFPMDSMQIAFRPEKGHVFTANHQELVRYNEKILPVLRLYQTFRVEPEHTQPENAVFVVVNGQKDRFAVMVDEILGQTQVVIKDLGLKTLSPSFQTEGILGGAIMGNGMVALVLHIEGLSKYL